MAKNAKPKNTGRAASKAKTIEKSRPASPWLGDNPPWEEYAGLQMPIVDNGEIVKIMEMDGGSLKMMDPSALREGDNDPFEFGGSAGSRVVFSQSNEADVLLTDDVKLRGMEMSYKFDREDPVYHGIIQGYLNFVIGQGIKFKARDENTAVQEYLERFWRENRLDGKDASWVRAYLKTGELAVRWFTKDELGRPAKVPKVRLVPFWRIVKVVKDGQDYERVTEYELAIKTGTSATLPVTPEQMSLWHNGDAEEARGAPPFLPVMRACKWYSDWLLNRVVLNRFRTAHVLFKKIISGSPNRVSGVSSSSPDASKHVGSGGKYEKRLPKPGTMVIHNDSIEYEWKSPNLGSGDANIDGKAILTYIATGAQVPEFLLVGASETNFASTLVSENPFVRQVQFYQDMFTGIFREVFARVIRHGIDNKAIPAKSWETAASESSAMMRSVRRVLRALGVNEGALGKSRKEVDTKTDVDIVWPSLIHADQLQEAQTLQLHQAMGAASIETIRQKLNYDNEVEERRIGAEREAGVDTFAADRAAEIAASGDGDGLPAGGANDEG